MTQRLTRKLLIIGADGKIGRSLYPYFLKQGYCVVGTSRRTSSNFLPFDLCNPNFSQIDLRTCSHAFICAAQCNVRECELMPELTYACNVRGTMLAVEILQQHSVQPILFSTDYVFDGIQGNYVETDLPNPLNEYGRQKFEMEKGALEYGCKVFRLSKVYETRFDPHGLLGEMVHKIKNGETIRVAHDQTFSPLYIGDLNLAMQKVLEGSYKGLYHLCGPQIWTRYEIARMIAERIGAPLDLVEAISLEDLREPLQRPRNTSMSAKKWEKMANHQLTPLSQHLARIKEMICG